MRLTLCHISPAVRTLFSCLSLNLAASASASAPVADQLPSPLYMAPEISGRAVVVQIFHTDRLKQKRVLVSLAVAAENWRKRALHPLFAASLKALSFRLFLTS